MVTIKIVVEGGVLPHSNIESQTIMNSEKLRESFYKLITQVVEPKFFNLEIEMGAGEKNASKVFKKSIQKNYCSLLIDLDGSIEKKEERLVELELEEYSDFVFFMIQQMEAWILSQPASIEKGMSFFEREKVEKQLADDPIFRQVPIEIENPADKLNTILSRYYSYEKRNKKRKKKYGKLKDASLFIENIDIQKLMDAFEDVKNLFDYIKTTMYT